MNLARKIHIKFPVSWIENANIISARKKTVLFVDSYHRGYEWSDCVTDGLLSGFGARLNSDDSVDNANSRVDLSIIRLDTRRHKTADYMAHIAAEVKAKIQANPPDLLILSDDNASKLLARPFLSELGIPVVFCGVNWSAGGYPYPTGNTTGIVEVVPVHPLLDTLALYARGPRIGHIGVDAATPRKVMAYIENTLGITFVDAAWVTTFSEWKQAYLRLQNSVDMLLVRSHVGIEGWDDAQAAQFVARHSRIPSGTYTKPDVRFALLGLVEVGSEQGRWAAEASLKILSGQSPDSIPQVFNKETEFYFNRTLARKLKVKPLGLVKKMKINWIE